MRPATPEPLKLVALDEDDLKILSAHLQDAVLRMSDMAWISFRAPVRGDPQSLRLAGRR